MWITFENLFIEQDMSNKKEKAFSEFVALAVKLTAIVLAVLLLFELPQLPKTSLWVFVFNRDLLKIE